MAYVFLVSAILAEVFATSMMKLTSISSNKKVLSILGVIIGYALAFYLLSLSLISIPLSFAYAAWSGTGTALTALVGFLIFKEKITIQGAVGILLLIVGVVLMRI
ncbi:quaternary ammonium transporter [Nosocomiicoccus sp. HMSC067E10]|uniref:DMT family transporter n=1 Tax=Nosocomiicoccus sp. HMSC067E10 TaxID=1739271 RepID=UPI0008A64021|nr:multidrug efflux SMR transporter [Nosocomiicoccus sp. HMSC067E10]OFL48729.1 quaternary ammonium transporter [Nosocomiicoccus sp. HMSC067E10]